jgi:outer membrane protein assembly factor BamA
MDWENRYCPRDSNFSVSFSVPYFLKTKGDLTTKISYGWKNYCYVTKEIYDEFSVLYTPEISIKYVYPIFRDLFHFKVIYNYLKTKAEKIDAEIPYLQQQKNEICANNIVFSLSYFVDFEPFSKRIPHHSIDVSIDYCLYSDILGSDINVEKYEIYTNFCLPFLFNNILSITTDFSLNKTGDRTKQTPIFLRYFPGGLVKISGYDFWGQIGPPEGGDVNMVVSLRYVIPFSSSLPIVVTPFFEFGNAWRKTEDILWSFGTNDNMIKRSIGIGISYYGLIGIQYSHGLDAKQTEPSDFWYIGLAQPW